MPVWDAWLPRHRNQSIVLQHLWRTACRCISRGPCPFAITLHRGFLLPSNPFQAMFQSRKADAGVLCACRSNIEHGKLSSGRQKKGTLYERCLAPEHSLVQMCVPIFCILSNGQICVCSMAIGYKFAAHVGLLLLLCTVAPYQISTQCFLTAFWDSVCRFLLHTFCLLACIKGRGDV